jgi:hypothetical protein
MYQIKKIGGPESYEIMTRLILQSDELLGFCTMSKERKQQVIEHFHQLQPRLVTCDVIAKRVSAAVDTIAGEVNAKGFETQPHAIAIPQVLDLERDVEQFLISAKDVLRDAAGLFKIFFDKEFDGPKYDEIIKWCGERFGQDHHLAQLLLADQEEWIRELIYKRNAAEHPGGRSGHLHIHNFEFDEATRNFYVPAWQRNDEQRRPIAQNLTTYVDNMITFCEDLLVVSMKTVGIMPAVDFAIIPEAERTKDRPHRVRVVLAVPAPF